MKPSWRKPAGIFMMLGLILLVCIVIMLISDWIATLPVVVQLLLLAVVGLVWILPLRPLLLWMETGRWR